MKKTTTLFALIISFLVSSGTVGAGKLKGKISKPGDNGMISVSLNGNGGTSKSSGISNAFSFNPNAGIDVSWGNFGLGLDASTFTTKSNFDFDAYASPLKSLDFITVSGTGSNWRSLSVVFGPSYTIPLGISKPIPGVGIVVKKNRPGAAITISIKGGLTFNEAPDFSVIANSTQKKIAFYTPSADYQKTALTIKPSIAFRYWFSQNVALNANVQYAIQTGQTEFTTGYKDLTNVSLATPLSPDQFNKNISTAPNISTTTVGPDKYLSAGIGITYCFGKKGWDGSIKGNRKGISEGGLKKNEVERKGISENGLKKNEVESILTDAEVKSIAETLVTMRKGWDGSIKGNKAENVANTADVKAIAETLVNIARKGWDGSIKGNKAEYVANEADIKSVTETLETIRKGWDGSIKGNKTEYVANEVDVKAIAETLVNLRKGWDGSVKGNKKGINENGLKKNETQRKGWDGSIKGTNVSIPINGNVIHVQTTPEGCIVLFPDNGFAINSKEKTMTILSKTAHTSFGEKVNAGLHAAGGALAQGASLLGGALPGGAVISAAVSSVSTKADGGAAASNTKATDKKKKKKVWDSGRDNDCDGLANIPDGDYEIEVKFENTLTSKSAKADQTVFTIEFSSVSNVLKTKHDTVKNSINNVR
jgi:hypothetical protein